MEPSLSTGLVLRFGLYRPSRLFSQILRWANLVDGCQTTTSKRTCIRRDEESSSYESTLLPIFQSGQVNNQLTCNKWTQQIVAPLMAARWSGVWPFSSCMSNSLFRILSVKTLHNSIGSSGETDSGLKQQHGVFFHQNQVQQYKVVSF